MNNTLRNAALILAAAFTMAGTSSCASMTDSLIWKTEDADKPMPGKPAQAKQEKAAEITPVGLEETRINPISPEETARTALSRPKVVKVEEAGLGNGANKRYFEVVDEKAQTPSGAAVDEGAKPTRVVTYDNNSVLKEYNLKFGVAWNRIVDTVVDLPLTTLDRSSGMILTGWIYDERKDKDALISINPFGGDAVIRYRYNVRIADKGASVQIKVVPFTEVFKGTRWEEAKPNIVVTDRLFKRLERELAIPLASE
ncbi:MAG: hypothetical protein HZB29_03875 [Nitrospinae bacterium]|nr:hypothetical protein [Nitrospinota bacterium]